MRKLLVFAMLLVGCKSDGAWFCSTNICSGDRAECERMPPLDSDAHAIACSPARIAFCPVDGAKSDAWQCSPTLKQCEQHRTDDPNTRCIGVE